MLRQKSRVKWILEGDANTKFFHSSLSHRRRAGNAISRLEKENGVVLMDESLIEEELLSFFSSLYAKDPYCGWGVEGLDCCL